MRYQVEVKATEGCSALYYVQSDLDAYTLFWSLISEVGDVTITSEEGFVIYFPAEVILYIQIKEVKEKSLEE